MDSLIADPLTRFIAQVVAIIALSRLIGLGARRLGQPMVIAEMLAGILLGPSLLGWLLPGVSAALFSPDSLRIMSTVSQVGLVLFMFLIGLELDHRLLRGRGPASLVISSASTIIPFALGGVLALYLYPRFADSSFSLVIFALFMGAFIAVTAFPVLARILAERRLLRSRVGTLTVACAAVADVSAWCILAFVVAAARASGHADALVTTALAILYVGAMMLVVRPLLVRLAARVATPDAMSQNVAAVVLVLVLLSSWVTELIGIHALFGAFLFGAILPKDGGFARALVEKVEDLVIIALVPLFFAYSGLRTEIGLLDSGYNWAVCGLIIVVATLGKVGSGAIAAHLSGLSWRESGALGVLMNTRGLMGVIVLNVGLDLGVISTTLFSMMIIMALVTTFLTTPLLEWIYPAQAMARDLVESLEASEQRPEPAAPEYRILVCVSHAEAAPRLIAMAGALVRGRERTRIYALHLVPPSDRPSLNLTSGADDAVPRALERAIEAADDLGIDVKPLSFVSPDPADDICRVATVRETDLVLLGCHKPVLGTSALGGVVGEVLRQSPTTVAVLVGGGLRQRGRILVPFQDSPHDRTALVVAGRLAGAADGSVTILRAAPPGRAPDPMGPSLETLQSLVRSGASGYQASAEVPVALEMVRGTSLGEAAAARSADGYEIVVAGVGPDGAPEERGRNPGRLIRDCASSLLLVRGAEAALARAVER